MQLPPTTYLFRLIADGVKISKHHIRPTRNKFPSLLLEVFLYGMCIGIFLAPPESPAWIFNYIYLGWSRN